MLVEISWFVEAARLSVLDESDVSSILPSDNENKTYLCACKIRHMFSCILIVKILLN